MRYRRMPIEVESPEQLGYDTITNNLSESSVADRRLRDLGLDLDLDDLLDERIAGTVLAARSTVLPPILADVRARLDIVRAWMAAQSTFEWAELSGGVVGLVRARPGIPLDTARFYDRLLAEHGTYVGPGHWFEVNDRHFRLGYGWPTVAEPQAGLAGLTAAGAESVTP